MAVDLSVAAEPVGPSGMVRSVFTALAFDAFLYCCGRFVVAPYVLRGCSSVPRRLFAASFSLSLALLTLVLVEVLGMLTPSARLFLWRLHLALHLFLLVILLPLVQWALLLRRKLHLSQAGPFFITCRVAPSVEGCAVYRGRILIGWNHKPACTSHRSSRWASP